MIQIELEDGYFKNVFFEYFFKFEQHFMLNFNFQIGSQYPNIQFLFPRLFL